jgi:hypothetical protein
MLPSLTNEVKELINEGSGLVWWPNGQVEDAINEAIVDLSMYLKWDVITTPFTVTTGSGDIFAWDNTLIMIPQFFLINGLKMFLSNQAELENWSRRWRNETPGQPKWFLKWDESHFRVFPTPDATYTFDLWGIPWEPEFPGEATDLTVDPMLRHAIAFRAASILLELTQPQLADMYMQDSIKHEMLYSTHLRKQLGANSARLRPGYGWTNAQFGRIAIGRKYI